VLRELLWILLEKKRAYKKLKRNKWLQTIYGHQPAQQKGTRVQKKNHNTKCKHLDMYNAYTWFEKCNLWQDILQSETAELVRSKSGMEQLYFGPPPLDLLQNQFLTPEFYSGISRMSKVVSTCWIKKN
jgi:hypothetical protein